MGFFLIEPKFDGVMTFSPHKGMDLAKICISKMVYSAYCKDTQSNKCEGKDKFGMEPKRANIQAVQTRFKTITWIGIKNNGET